MIAARAADFDGGVGRNLGRQTQAAAEDGVAHRAVDEVDRGRRRREVVGAVGSLVAAAVDVVHFQRAPGVRGVHPNRDGARDGAALVVAAEGVDHGASIEGEDDVAGDGAAEVVAAEDVLELAFFDHEVDVGAVVGVLGSAEEVGDLHVARADGDVGADVGILLGHGRSLVAAAVELDDEVFARGVGRAGAGVVGGLGQFLDGDIDGVVDVAPLVAAAEGSVDGATVDGEVGAGGGDVGTGVVVEGRGVVVVASDAVAVAAAEGVAYVAAPDGDVGAGHVAGVAAAVDIFNAVFAAVDGDDGDIGGVV